MQFDGKQQVMNGKIIVLEGTDGSGKQTQSELLYSKLLNKNDNVIKMTFPNYKSESSAPVKMYLKGEICAHADELDAYQTSVLFAIDRMITMQSKAQFYESGGTIVLDRYVMSNIIHQGGKIVDKNKREKFYDWLVDFEFGKLKLPKPDLVIFLDMPYEMSQKLANSRRDMKNGGTKDIHEQDSAHLLHAYDSAVQAAEKFGWVTVHCVKDGALRDREDVSLEILSIVEKIR